MKMHPHRPPVLESVLEELERLVDAGHCRRLAITLLYPLPPGIPRDRQEAGDYVETLVFERVPCRGVVGNPAGLGAGAEGC